MTRRRSQSRSLNASRHIAATAPVAPMAAIKCDPVAQRYERGDVCRVTGPDGRKLDAIYDGVDFVGRTGSISHRVKVELPTSYSKSGYRRCTWYITSARFVL